MDASGDAPTSVDVTSAWFTSTATHVSFTFKLRDLAQSSPALGSEGAYHNYYRVDFTLSTNNVRYYIEGALSFVDSQTAAGVSTPHTAFTVGTNVGAHATAGRVDGITTYAATISVNAAADTLTVSLARNSPSIPTGAVLSSITVTTAQNASPHEAAAGLSNIIGGGHVTKDTAVGSRAFTVL